MAIETELCEKFLLSAEWDRALAVFPDKNYVLTEEDYENRAYARCFQATKAHNDGNYDDIIADASKALVKNCQNNRALCIRAYGYYLNSNYDDAITDCEKVIERASCGIEAQKQKMKDAWEKACKKIADADVAKEAADEAEKAGAPDKDALKQAAETAKTAAEAAVKTAKQAQADYCASLHRTAFAHELLGMIYSNMGSHLGASKHYKLALLYRQTDIVPASPLLMDAYRNTRAAVKGI